MPRTTPVSHTLSLALYFIILGLLVLTTFWPDPVEGASVLVILVIKLVPLLILMPGLLKSRGRTFQWLCFVLMIYFTDASVRSYLTELAWPPTLMAVLTAGLFITSIVRIRAFGKPKR